MLTSTAMERTSAEYIIFWGGEIPTADQYQFWCIIEWKRNMNYISLPSKNDDSLQGFVYLLSNDPEVVRQIWLDPSTLG